MDFGNIRIVFSIILVALLFGCVNNNKTNDSNNLKITNSYSDEVGIMKLSSVFDNGENVPKKYTCDGNDINPALKISDVPAAAKSLVLIVDDPDAPGGTFVHWIAYNIDPKTKEIPEGVSLGTGGMNDFGTTKYGGPCPPPGSPHTYRFKLYAVDFDSWPLFEIPPDKAAIESFMEGHIIAQAELDGKYQR